MDFPASAAPTFIWLTDKQRHWCSEQSGGDGVAQGFQRVAVACHCAVHPHPTPPHPSDPRPSLSWKQKVQDAFDGFYSVACRFSVRELWLPSPGGSVGEAGDASHCFSLSLIG